MKLQLILASSLQMNAPLAINVELAFLALQRWIYGQLQLNSLLCLFNIFEHVSVSKQVASAVELIILYEAVGMFWISKTKM